MQVVEHALSARLAAAIDGAEFDGVVVDAAAPAAEAATMFLALIVRFTPE